MLGPSAVLQTLWQAAPEETQRFELEQYEQLPEPAKRYLAHAMAEPSKGIAPGTPLATAVRLRLRGEIKLKQWQPFSAEEVICWNQGMIWQAKTRIGGLPVSGWDRLWQGQGAMRWKLFGLVPMVSASGPDITRSAIGRMIGELIWLPSVFCQAKWEAVDKTSAIARLSYLGEPVACTLTTDEAGKLTAFSFPRWGNPEGEGYHFASFGGYAEAEGHFSGYTIPTQLRAGWYFGSDQFEPSGEFFRATIVEASYR